MKEKSFLPIREWVAVLCMLFSLAYLSTVVHKHKNHSFPDSSSIMQVVVVGEVKEEKTLSLPPGSTVADACAKITLLPTAQIEALALDAKLKEGQILIIPKRGALSVYLKGAVKQEGVYHLKEQATFKDLYESALFTDMADIKALKRKRRKLLDGETITIAAVRGEDTQEG